MGIIRKTIIIALGGAITAFCIGIAGILYLDKWSQKSLDLPQPILVELKSGTSLTTLSRDIAQQGLIDDSLFFQAWIRLDRSYHRFQSGSYQFQGSISPRMIRDKFLGGEVFTSIAIVVSIPEGFTLKQLHQRMVAKGIGSLSEIEKLSRNKDFLRELGVPSTTLEGYTFPATYSFETPPTAHDFFAKTVRTFFKRLPSDYHKKISEVGLTLNQAVTFASLIELETMLEEEKSMVSEVIWSRLKAREALGIDAALIYGIKDYKGDIKWEHLKDEKNKYNTRIHRGLPPTPIGAVSTSSLSAVLTPTNLGYHYYVVDGSDSSRHVFSRTNKEHNRAVQKYLKSLSDRK
jgi:UPF0755 protein